MATASKTTVRVYLTYHFEGVDDKKAAALVEKYADIIQRGVDFQSMDWYVADEIADKEKLVEVPNDDDGEEDDFVPSV